MVRYGVDILDVKHLAVQRRMLLRQWTERGAYSVLLSNGVDSFRDYEQNRHSGGHSTFAVQLLSYQVAMGGKVGVGMFGPFSLFVVWLMYLSRTISMRARY